MSKTGSNSQSISQSGDKENKNSPEEWPGFKTKHSGELLEKVVPLLIMELHRLEPYFEGSVGFPKIRVLNMPNVKLRQVELLGIIRKITSRSRLDLMIDDGTGKIQVLLQFSQMGEMKEERKLIDAKFQRFEKIAVIQKRGPEHMQDLERRWKQETKNGTLGMSFKVFEHVHVIGTIHVDFGNHNLNKRSLCLNTAKFVKPVIHAKRIYHLSEEEYNEKLQSWISGVVRERYQKLIST